LTPAAIQSGILMPSKNDRASSRDIDQDLPVGWTSGPAWVFYIAAVALAAQLLTANRYGIFRDELYYIDCGNHLAWGYVDQPPLIAFIAWLERHVTGDSLLSLRFLPALAGAATVWLAGKMARTLGGCRYAQILAALAVLLSLGYLAFFHWLTMNAFEPPIWTACAYVVVRITQTGNQKLWLWFGLLAGIGLENKYGMLFFGFGVFVGLLLTRERKAFAKPWVWLGGGIAMLVWLPNLIWNFAHHWPFLELMHNVRQSGRDVGMDPTRFLIDETLFMNPATAPLWMAGLVWLLFGKETRPDGPERRGHYRILGWTFLTMMVTFIVLNGKAYYIWPGFTMLFAAGGVAIDRWLGRLPGGSARPAFGALLVLGGGLFVPFTFPVLSPEGFIAYVKAMHVPIPQVEHQPLGPLGQQGYADMFGWKEMAEETARAYYALPADVRAKTAIAAGNYGDAGAIDFFGPALGLPAAISAHQSYWLWGPRDYTGESMLLLNSPLTQVAKICDQWKVVGRVEHPLSRLDEHFDIYWCQQHRWTLQQIWPQTKHWN
jgi:4-amino-4-deoxy-L-arabinose transferase-like glycosyltransferase